MFLSTRNLTKHGTLWNGSCTQKEVMTMGIQLNVNEASRLLQKSNTNNSRRNLRNRKLADIRFVTTYCTSSMNVSQQCSV